MFGTKNIKAFIAIFVALTLVGTMLLYREQIKKRISYLTTDYNTEREVPPYY